MMVDKSTTVAAIDSLLLNTFPDDWVKKCWEEDFLEVGNLPAQCEEHLIETQYLVEQLQSFQKVLSAWVKRSSSDEESEGFWSVIVTTDVPHKALIAVLGYLICNGAKVSANFTERSSGILAASVYIKLFVLPGSAAFKVYNPELFLQCCRLLNKWNAHGVIEGKKKRRSSSSSQASQPSQKKKRGRGKAKANTSEENSDMMADDDDAEDNEGKEDSLTPAEMKLLSCQMKILLMDVLLVCKEYSLRQSESTAVQLLAVLVNFAKMHSDAVTEKMGQWSGSNCSPGILAFNAIHLLCQPFHGHVSAMISQTFRRLLPHILMMEDGKVYSALARPVLMVRKQALDYIRFIVANLGDRSIPSLKNLIQHLSFKVPDKLDYRNQAAQAVAELLSQLPDLDFAIMLEWLKQLSKNKKVGQRSFVVDLMLLLLEAPERKLSAEVPAANAEFATHKSMVCVLLNRCSDINAGVRSRALVAFSSCTKSKYTAVVDTIKGVITPVNPEPQRKPRRFMPTPWIGPQTETSDSSTLDGTNDTASKRNSSESEQNGSCGNMTPVAGAAAASVHTPVADAVSFGNIQLTPGFDPYLPDAEGVKSMISRRVLDSKAVVRKCALQALQSFILFEAPDYMPEDLLALQERCADPALSVRKQAIQSLSELLQAWPRHKEIQRAWIFGTLPRVMDIETTVQDRCFDLLEELILMKLRQYKPGSTSDSNEWDLLNVITHELSEKLRRYLQKACQHWARNKKIKPSMISAVQSHVTGPNDEAAWMFLAELSKTNVKIDHSSVVEHWMANASSLQDLSNDDCGKWGNVLSVLGMTAKTMPAETVGALKGDLMTRLEQFLYPPFIIAGMVNCVSKLYASSTNENLQQTWGEDLMIACVRYLSNVIFKAENNTHSQLDEPQMIKYVFTLGEVCQRCPTRIPKKTTFLVQSVVAAPCISALSETDQPAPSQQLLDNGQPWEQQDSSHDSQSSESGSQSSQATTQPLSQFRGSKMSSILRAHGFITLGKLCLVDEALSKKIIAALARELEVCDSPAVRNNVVVIMGDLTVRYTTVVDRYVTNIAACLKDPSALVRKNTLTILTRLLQEEYVKWKGVLFFRYITTLLDEVEEIRNLAEFCMEHLLLKKHPNMFFNPFLECIFHFNNYQDHTTYNKFKQTDGEMAKFTVAGKACLSKRMKMYTFMLENMTDEHRFKVAAKLNKEILAAVVDKIIPMNEEGSALLRDTLAVLSCKEIKLTSLRGRAAGQEDEVEGSVEAQAQAAVSAVAKKAFISQVVRRNVIENIVPVVISLKHMFEKARSPLLRDLMMYLRELMKDYKNEVKDILASDKQLAEEIYFDLRSFENQVSHTVESVQGSRSGTPQPTNQNASTPQVTNQNPRTATKENARPGATPQSASRGASPARQGQTSRVSSPLVALPGAVNSNNVAASPGRGGGENQPAGESNTPAKEHNAEKSSRRASLTIKDAARRAMTRVEELRRSGALHSPGRKGSSPSRSRPSDQTFADRDMRERTSSQNVSEEDMSQSPSQRQQDGLNRAISTPTGKLSNITFGAECNVTMLPPSPIPSMATAIARGGLSLSPTIRVERKGERTIIHMPHPDQEEPKPQMWNVQSPGAKTATESIAVENKEGTPTRKSHAASREEYVKWKGVLFFRYITTLLDEVEEIRNLAEFCMEHLLLKKHPNMFFNPFLECIFHFNNYQDHTTYNKFKQTDGEMAKFTVAGKACLSKRMKMYTFMLENMTDEHRFKVAAKLNKEILAAVVDKIIPMNEEGSALLRDTLAVLSCKEIKLTSLRGRAAGQEDEVEGSVEAQAQAAVSAVAKKAFISQVVRRNVIENIVPVVISLKHMFEKARSPLLRDLMMYLRELMKDYKNEVKDILASDKQLAEEIYFDLRSFENQVSHTVESVQGSRSGTPQPTNQNASTPQVTNQNPRTATKENARPGATPQSASRGASPARQGQTSRVSSPLVALPGAVNSNNVAASPGRGGGENQPAGESNTPAKEHNAEKSSRRASLTIKDAARRAMTRVEELRRSGALHSPGRKGSSPSRSRPSDQTFADRDMRERTSSQNVSEEDMSQSPSQRQQDGLNRAISTPTGKLSNITFGAECNVTMLPPSPIPSMATAIARGGLSLSPTIRVERKGERTIIHMPHPDQEEPKPQMWNVQSPGAKTATESIAVENKEGTPTRKSHAASRVGLRSRRSRH